MNSFPCLETDAFLAFIADNSPGGIHRSGYNGIASLVPRCTGNNVFVPTYAGLNYETTSLSGLRPYESETGSKFEPRVEPIHIDAADAEHVVLVQPETSYAHVSARITFAVKPPHAIHQRIELVFHRRFCAEDEPNQFRSLWASYIHMPPDRHIYLKPDWPEGDDLSNWFGVTKAEQESAEMLVRPLPDGRELDAHEHLAVMQAAEPLASEAMSRLADAELSPMRLPPGLDRPLAFYYGLVHGPLLFLMIFKEPQRFRLAYAPAGAGQQPAWNPAWDYVLHLDDVQLGTPYVWDLCLVVKPYRGRAEVLAEVRRYMQT